jgi:hypothetical protein
MMMSVYRQGRTRSQLDHLACIDMAATAEDSDLITFALLNAKPTIVGLEGGTAVIKPLEAGDEAFTFETLYDTAVSAHDFDRLKRHQVRSPDELKPRLYELVIVANIDFCPQVRVRLKAKDEHDARIRLRKLMEPGLFSQRMVEEMAKQIFDSDHTEIATPGFLCVDDPSPDSAPDWDFIP